MEFKKRSEYTKTSNMLLDPDKQDYFRIPEDVITNYQIGDQRVATLAYISIYKGLNHKIRFSIDDLIFALGKTPDKRENRINSKIESSFNYLVASGYIKELRSKNNLGQTHLYDAKSLNNDNIKFAKIYADEAEKIFESKYSNKEVLFLVFAYLRFRITTRKNIEVENINEYRNSQPEVYDGYYSDIAKVIGISVYAVQKAVNALVELGLIYIEEQPRQLVRSSNGRERWMTGRTFFCNTYKRDGKYQYISGKQYYEKEIASKHYKLKNLKGGEAK